MADYETDDRRSLSPRREEPLRDDSRDEEDHRNGDDNRRTESERGEDAGGDAGPRRKPVEPPADDDEDAKNEGTNLYITGLARSITEAKLTEICSKSGTVDKVQIMLDPHTRESRGFGFVNMVSVEAADAVMNNLNGTKLEGKMLSIEKARRKRPRTPTPGKYFGPPKVRGRRPPPPRYDDRYRRDYYGRSRYDDRYDDYYRRPRYEDRDRYYRDRGYSRYDERDRYAAPAGGRYYRGEYPRGDYRDDRYQREDRYGRDRDYGRSAPPRSPVARDAPPRDYRDEERAPYRVDDRADRRYDDGYGDRDRGDDYR